MVKVEWNKSYLKQLDDILKETLIETAEATIQELNDKQLLPYRSGRLEENTLINTSMIDDKFVYIDSDPVSDRQDYHYAARLYYHPEFNFRQDIHNNAQGLWWEPIISSNFIETTYFNILKSKLGGI